jgi:iron complex outermembrane receptor protein
LRNIIYRFCFFIVALVFPLFSYSQSAGKGAIKGLITEKETGDPVIGANIYLKKEITTGTTSNIDGIYYLELVPGDYTIAFSYTGMKSETREIKIEDGKIIVINLNLEPFSYDFDEITISAGRYERTPEQLMVSTEMIGKAVIQAKNTVNISTVLDQMPGVNILDEEPQIRGGSGFTFGVGSKVAVILDDMPMINAAAGKPDWRLIPVENLKQVEVVKGPGSVLTGSNAMSGAIFFRNEYVGDNPRTNVRLYSGMFLSPKNKAQKWWSGMNYTSGVSFLHAQYLDKQKSVELVVSGMGNFEKGYQGAPVPGREYQFGDTNITDSDIKGNSGRFNFNLRKQSQKIKGLNFGINGSVMVESSSLIFAWFDDTTNFYRAYPGAILLQDKNTYYIDPNISLLTVSGAKHSLMFRLMGEQNDLSNGQFSNTTSFFGKYEFSKEFANFKDLEFIGGVSGMGTYSNANIYEASGSNKNNATNVSLYLQLEKTFMKTITLQVGFRGEYYDLNKTEAYTVPLLRTSLNFKLMQETYLRVSYGQGTRFPTIAERYISTNLGAIGVFDNPDLQPESGWNAEIGLKQGIKFAKFYGYIDIAGFLQEYENTVEYLFGIWGNPAIKWPFAGFKFVNTGDSRITGIDFSLNGQAKWGKNQSMTILGGYTFILPITLTPDYIFASDYANREFSYNSTSVDPVGEILKYRFQHTYKLDVQYNFSKFFVGMSIRYFSKMQNLDNSIFEFEQLTKDINSNQLPPILYEEYYNTHNSNTIFDGRVGYELNEHNRISLISTNLFNRMYSLRPLKAEQMQNITLQYLGFF